MCGIFGLVYHDGQRIPDTKRLRATIRLLNHRGPDGSGIHAEPGVGLAHTRLSLVDLSERSNQPFWDETQRYALVYNGEIYEFQTLRQELEREGAVFRTTGDTEVLLQSLILRGARETLNRIRGMFAFALYDSKERTLVLARDRFGIKPLNIYQDNEIFAFASEIKAFQPFIDLRANSFPMASYLLGFGGPTSGRCFYKGVHILPPGTLITLSVGGSPQLEHFHRLGDELDSALTESLTRLRPTQMVDYVEERLSNAVDRMLVADAEIGGFCSGGVDSSILMAMAARRNNNLKILHANVIGPNSEYEAASALARYLNLELKTVDIKDNDFIELIPEVTYHYEHPFGYHPNSIPFLMVSKLARDHGVKGVLSGEGADECFLGYSTLGRERLKRFYTSLTARLHRVVHRIPKFGDKIWPYESNTGKLVKGMLSGFEREVEERYNRTVYAQVLGDDTDLNVRTIDLLGYHLRSLMHRNDCLGMAGSIEARFPFLDEEVVHTAINLPYHAKFRPSLKALNWAHPFLHDKWVLRQVANRYMPTELSQRKKRGFQVTAFRRMRISTAYFKDSYVTTAFGLDGDALDYLIEKGEQTLLVRLLLLEVWAEIFVCKDDLDLIKQRLRRYISIKPN